MSGFDSKEPHHEGHESVHKHLDKTDWDILRELQADARISYAELGRRVGLSSPAVQERMRKLEDAHIIQSYHAVVNPRQVGYPIVALIRIATQENNPKVRRVVESMPYVIDSYRVLGNDAYIIKVAVPNSEELWQLCERFHGICMTTTAIVTDVVAENAPITRNFGAEVPPKS